jgi:predicted ferric reductase
MIARIDPQTSWLLARASGLVAWAVVTATLLVGLGLSTRFVRKRGVPAQLLDLHRFFGALSLVFVAVHLGGLWLDSYVYFGPRELLVPLASRWRPAATAWGVVTLYLMVAIQLTSWAMKRIPRRLWRAVHFTSFALFVTATLHGLQAGTDARNLVSQWLCLTGVTLVVFLCVFRILTPRRRSAAPVHVAEAASA